MVFSDKWDEIEEKLTETGAIGAKLHIPFSVAIRASFGYYLAYFCIVSRCILAMFWLGIQGANGAQCITIMIQAIWPSYNETNIPNHIALNQGITSLGMVRYFLPSQSNGPLLTSLATSSSGSSNSPFSSSPQPNFATSSP
jgi:cytosine/uracil/thiamine/allantoin permease